jgi:hypothetical protein
MAREHNGQQTTSSGMGEASSTLTSPQRFVKRYRTEVAASASSVLSTVGAVRLAHTVRVEGYEV